MPGRRKAARYVAPTHRADFSCCPDLQKVGFGFEQVGRSNAAETVGAARLDSREGVDVERASVSDAIDNAQGRHWNEYRDFLEGPLSEEEARRLQAHFSAWYGWVLKELAR